MARTPNLGLELFTPLGEGWREDATAGLLLDENMALIDAALGHAGSSVSVNSASVANPNFVNSATVTFSVTGSSVSATAAGLSGTPALPSGTTAATVPNPSDASANVATDAFVQSAVQLSMGTVPLNLASQGPATYSFACLGTGSKVNFTASGGAITSITIWIPFVGSGYKTGDLVSVAGGNNDAILAISAVGGAGYPTSGVILYGGTGYTSGTSAAIPTLSSIPFTFLLSGALSGNIEFLMTPGTYQTQSNQWIFCNNCTGAYTITIAVSNSTNTGWSGGRTVVIPPGTNNSSSTFVQTDGELNVDLVTDAIPRDGGTMSGALLFSPDNSYTIGASGATRPSYVYAGSAVVAPVGNFGNIVFTTEIQIAGAATITGQSVALVTGQPISWNADSGISRLAADSLAIGNGTAGDFSGSLTLTGLNVQGSQTGPYSVSLTAQAATIAATNLVTTPVTTALYEITYYLNDTTAGTSGTVSLTITWNDGGSQTFTSSNVTLSTLGAYVSGTIVVKATSGAIQYATTVTIAFGSVGSPAYSLDIRVKQLA